MGAYETSRGKRCAQAFDHIASVVLNCCLVAAVAFALHAPEYPVPQSPLLMLWFITPLLVVSLALFSWQRMRVHERSMCEFCAGAIPLNPMADATRRRRRFWVAHRAGEPRFLLPYLALLIGSNFMTDPAARIGWAVVQLTITYVILSYVTHCRLQPWCPECNVQIGAHPRAD